MSAPDLSTLAPLHPDRIRSALKCLKNLQDNEVEREHELGIESGIAALKLLAKSQQALGITGQGATAVSQALQFLNAMKSLK